MANKQLKNHFRAYEAMQLDAHFEERDLKFKQMELDPVTGQSNGIKKMEITMSYHAISVMSCHVMTCLRLRVYTRAFDSNEPACGLIMFYLNYFYVLKVKASSGLWRSPSLPRIWRQS